MAKISMIVKNTRRKHPNQHRNRCLVCGRPRAFMGDFGMCRCCFRKYADAGQIPGVRKASW